MPTWQNHMEFSWKIIQAKYNQNKMLYVFNFLFVFSQMTQILKSAWAREPPYIAGIIFRKLDNCLTEVDLWEDIIAQYFRCLRQKHTKSSFEDCGKLWEISGLPLLTSVQMPPSILALRPEEMTREVSYHTWQRILSIIIFSYNNK